MHTLRVSDECFKVLAVERMLVGSSGCNAGDHRRHEEMAREAGVSDRHLLLHDDARHLRCAEPADLLRQVELVKSQLVGLAEHTPQPVAGICGLGIGHAVDLNAGRAHLPPGEVPGHIPDPLDLFA